MDEYYRAIRLLPAWLAQHGEGLRSVLKPNLIAFGEWCAAKQIGRAHV